jgi:hypothetical protein
VGGDPARGSGEAEFVRGGFGRPFSCARLGDGEIGGKARGLVEVRETLAAVLDAGDFPGIELGIPSMTVLTTSLFDGFVRENGLVDLPLEELTDERIAHAFQQGDLPVEHLGDLRSIAEEASRPLAVRSSSQLEDALGRPFAGVYATKMLPVHELSSSDRFRRISEAIKLVWASTWFRAARRYREAAGRSTEDERMAVLLQEVVGRRHEERFYPEVSGVARSWNYYPMGGAAPEEGIVQLALGLGRAIVDENVGWSFSPRRPTAPPPFASARDRMKATQTSFWAVNLGNPPSYDPVSEVEYLVRADLKAAEWDGTLAEIASTYDPQSDRLVPGTAATGARVLDFSPLLEYARWPFARLLRDVLAAGEESVGAPVECEFAATISDDRLRIGFLQIRPMVVPGGEAEVAPEEMERPGTRIRSDHVLGHGTIEGVCDVVYVRPDRYDPAENRETAAELAGFDRALRAAGRPYVLVGFGRWGSSEPWLGIPVVWGDIAGARVIVEAALPGIVVDPSQGSHFFHNLTSFEVPYLFVPEGAGPAIDWEWLDGCQRIDESDHVRHARTDRPLDIRVDGRAGRAVIRSD